MSRDDLIPERVLAKDGTSVIRWVKPGKKKTAKSSKLPAPGIFQNSADNKGGLLSAGTTKKEKREQKAARHAEHTRQMDYIQTEARLRMKYQGNKYFSSSDVSEVLKALREDGQQDPSGIVDEDLLISYAEFKEFAWKQHSGDEAYSATGAVSNEVFRQQVTRLAGRYVTHPEERESLARAVRNGSYSHA